MNERGKRTATSEDEQAFEVHLGEDGHLEATKLPGMKALAAEDLEEVRRNCPHKDGLDLVEQIRASLNFYECILLAGEPPSGQGYFTPGEATKALRAMLTAQKPFQESAQRPRLLRYVDLANQAAMDFVRQHTECADDDEQGAQLWAESESGETFKRCMISAWSLPFPNRDGMSFPEFTQQFTNIARRWRRPQTGDQRAGGKRAKGDETLTRRELLKFFEWLGYGNLNVKTLERDWRAVNHELSPIRVHTTSAP